MTRFCYLLVIGWFWLPLMSHAAPVPAAQLSVEQQQWLAQHPELRVGLVLQAPYAKFDQRLQQLSGANVELMKWLAQALNVELRWRNYPDLAHLEAAARAGERHEVGRLAPRVPAGGAGLGVRQVGQEAPAGVVDRGKH